MTTAEEAGTRALIKKKKKFLPVLLALAAIIVWLVWPSDESIYVGTIEVTETDVASRVESQIAERVRDEGDIVKTGDLLYRMTCEDQLVEMEKAGNDFERAKKLLSSGNMSPETFDSFKRNYAVAKLNVDWCNVKSPMDATILTKFHEGGDHVFVGTKLMALGDLNDVWAYVYVDQPMLVNLSIGQDVTGVLPELHSKRIAGKIIHIKDEAEFTPKNVQTRKERTRLVYGVKIRFDNSENLLKPGMPIEVRFPKLK